MEIVWILVENTWNSNFHILIAIYIYYGYSVVRIYYGFSDAMDQSPINQNFELNKSKQKFHHSLKEHHKISNIPKFRCEML